MRYCLFFLWHWLSCLGYLGIYTRWSIVRPYHMTDTIWYTFVKCRLSVVLKCLNVFLWLAYSVWTTTHHTICLKSESVNLSTCHLEMTAWSRGGGISIGLSSRETLARTPPPNVLKKVWTRTQKSFWWNLRNLYNTQWILLIHFINAFPTQPSGQCVPNST